LNQRRIIFQKTIDKERNSLYDNSMPIYEFECQTCSHQFEQLMSASAHKPACPKCRGRKVEKLFSTFGCKSDGQFSGAAGGHSCGGCTSHNCGSCH